MKNIMDTLEKTIDRKLDLAQGAEDYGLVHTFFHQAFGAAQFAMAMMDNWDKEELIVDKWEKEWKPAFEKIMMEV